MPNRALEQELIDGFVQKLRGLYDDLDMHNSRCRSKEFADIEFTLPNGQRWAIEAKSHRSADRFNTIHKIFGELLKETGRDNRENCKIGVLIPFDEGGPNFYMNGFNEIERAKFIRFGGLIPVRHVFTYDDDDINPIVAG